MLSILSEENIDFVLVGAYAMAVHGYPRATGDLDIFVRPEKDNAEKLYKALAKFGAPLKEVTLDDFQRPGIIFQIGVAPRRIDIITEIDGVSFDSANKDKIKIDMEGLSIPVISRKKLIINKESTGREKDALDAKVLKSARY
jgi:hypothetical protein